MSEHPRVIRDVDDRTFPPEDRHGPRSPTHRLRVWQLAPGRLLAMLTDRPHRLRAHPHGNAGWEAVAPAVLAERLGPLFEIDDEEDPGGGYGGP